MANQPIRMNTIRELISLKSRQLSGRTIATALGISRTTVNKYLEQLDKTGLSAQHLLALSDADLWKRVEPPMLTPSRYAILEALFPQME